MSDRVAASPDTSQATWSGWAAGSSLFWEAERRRRRGRLLQRCRLCRGRRLIAGGCGGGVGDCESSLKRPAPLIEAKAGLDELKYLKRGSVLIGLLHCPRRTADVEAYARDGISASPWSLPRLPAPSKWMSCVTGQLAGYKAVLDAVAEFGRAFPMMMNAAGTIKAARVWSGGGCRRVRRRHGAAPRASVSALTPRRGRREAGREPGRHFNHVDEAAARSRRPQKDTPANGGGYQRGQREKSRDDEAD